LKYSYQNQKPDRMKKMKLFTIGLGLCFLIINTGCSKDTRSLADATDNGSVRTAANPVVYAGKVSITSSGYTPIELLITDGGTVLWTNNDNAVHTVTADNGSFDSGDLQPGSTFVYKFSRGVYKYHCKYHPEMTGSVTAMVK
jgi:plastocyanin